MEERDANAAPIQQTEIVEPLTSTLSRRERAIELRDLSAHLLR
jgi:hypothetical protein